MSLLRIDASIRHTGSASRALADISEAHWLETATERTIIRREIGTAPLPSTAWGDAVTASALPAHERTPAQADALNLASTLVDELVAADAYLFAVPLYNFGPSQHFKTYADLVIADPRMGPGLTPVTAGKPGILVTVQGGNYSAGTPKEGWDHATGWMRRILEDVWHIDLNIVTREFTLVGTNPALDDFTDMAEEIKTNAEHHARRHGRTLAVSLHNERAAAGRP